MIVLYDDLVHVDLRSVALSEFPHPEEDLHCRVLWERDALVTERLPGVSAPQARVDVEWLEARMWTWVWYTQTKILRGEVYEALDILQYLRTHVLFPLLAVTRGQRTSGSSRRGEQLVGELQQDFEETVAVPARPATMEALGKTVDLYLRLADPMLEKREHRESRSCTTCGAGSFTGRAGFQTLKLTGTPFSAVTEPRSAIGRGRARGARHDNYAGQIHDAIMTRGPMSRARSRGRHRR